jgi:hypothetical protein
MHVFELRERVVADYAAFVMSFIHVQGLCARDVAGGEPAKGFPRRGPRRGRGPVHGPGLRHRRAGRPGWTGRGALWPRQGLRALRGPVGRGGPVGREASDAAAPADRDREARACDSGRADSGRADSGRADSGPEGRRGPVVVVLPALCRAGAEGTYGARGQACNGGLLLQGAHSPGRALNRRPAGGRCSPQPELAKPSVGEGHVARPGHAGRLQPLAQSDLERRFLNIVDASGYRLPLEAPPLFSELGARPDFLYEGTSAAISVGGPHHGPVNRVKRDAGVTSRLEDSGREVLRLRTVDDWEAALRARPDVFRDGFREDAKRGLEAP